MIKPWQAWCYSGSLIVAAVVYYGFALSLLLYLTSGRAIPVLSQKPASAAEGGSGLALMLAMWTRPNAILMLAMLTLRTAAFRPDSGAALFRLNTPYAVLNRVLWLLALVATIPCFLIYLVVDAPIAELMSPQGTLAAAGAANLGWLAALSTSLLLYDAAYIANTREGSLIAELGWKSLGRQIAAFFGRLAFYLIHPLLGVLFILTWAYDRLAQRRLGGEAPA